VVFAVLSLITSLAASYVTGPAGHAEAATGAGVVDVYGDSLMSEVAGELQFQLGLGDIPSAMHYFPGTALCDWVPTIRARVASSQSAMVVIEFSGNAFTPCMAGVSSQYALVAKYQSDLADLATWLHARGVPLMVVAKPPGLLPNGDPVVIPATWSVGQIPQGYFQTDSAINDMYAAAVAGFQKQGWDVGYIAADAAVAAPDGSWTYVLPCLSFETASMGCDPRGLIQVRDSHFGHFCPAPVPVSGGGTICRVWDGGGWRYALAISSGVSSNLAARPGYRLADSGGGVFAFGAGTEFYDSVGPPGRGPVVSMASAPDGLGYWLVASDGGVLSCGNAHFYGSTGATTLNQPIVGMAPTPDGHGYWLVASDGGIFSFGDAHFYGSTGATTLDEPIVGIAAK
jgi:hypothetical protein